MTFVLRVVNPDDNTPSDTEFKDREEADYEAMLVNTTTDNNAVVLTSEQAS